MSNMSYTEKQIETMLKKTIEKNLGGWCIKLLSVHLVGLPDRLCLLPGGHVFFVETKATGKKPRKIQLIAHKKIIDLGFAVYVVDSYEQIKGLELLYA